MYPRRAGKKTGKVSRWKVLTGIGEGWKGVRATIARNQKNEGGEYTFHRNQTKEGATSALTNC